MDTSSAVLALRVALALATVLALLWFLGRRAAGSKAGALRRTRAAALTVVTRQSLGGRTGVALVEVGGRHLVLGVSEHGVSLLTEVAPPEPVEDHRTTLDTAELERLLLDPADAPAGPLPSTPAARMPAVPTPRSPLEGSILDATTWRRAVVAVQERTLRR